MNCGNLLVENCDIKLEILNKLAHLNQLETQITVMSETQSYFFSLRFFSCPRNYYNDNDVIFSNVDYIELVHSLRLKDLCKFAVKLTRSSQVGFTHFGSGLLHGFMHP